MEPHTGLWGAGRAVPAYFHDSKTTMACTCVAKERRPVRGPRHFGVATDPRMKVVENGCAGRNAKSKRMHDTLRHNCILLGRPK